MSNSSAAIKILIADQSKSFLAWANQACRTHNIEIIDTLNLYDIEHLAQLHHPQAILINCAFSLDGEDEFIKVIKSEKSKINSSLPMLIYSDLSCQSLNLKLINLGVEAIVGQEFLTKNFLACILMLQHRASSPNNHLSEIKQKIGEHKHEFGNLLSILFGKQMKLEMVHPELKNDPSFVCIKDTLQRVDQLVKKLNLLRKYPEGQEQVASSQIDLKRAANE